ncbi:PAS domain S-box protein [Moorena sp. SIO4G3]|uniref:PAS domain-containing sensor histidine kinase n=1 Tax=Moorena sp. SIO4G3 TaxID=2607821 RepID=UPI00142942F3|nr:PAS domain S-box protein [Moorena sp. SIO4G3]NEO76758.1 PAS domain S-box protein [Moorena sp. SIO4G3]
MVNLTIAVTIGAAGNSCPIDQRHMLKTLQEMFSGHYIFHEHCYVWKPELVGLHAGSDLLIALSYYSILLLLIYVWSQHQDLPLLKILLLFSALVLCCGTSHLLEVWTIWHPDYWLSGLVKGTSAILSLSSAIALVVVMPKVLAFSSRAPLEATNTALEKEIAERKQTLEELLRSQQTLSLLVEQTPLGFIEWSLDGQVMQWNHVAEKIFGYKKMQAFGHRAHELIKPQSSVKQLQRVLQDCLNFDYTNCITENYHPQDGSSIFCQWHNAPLIESDGTVIGVVSVVEDITKRKLEDDVLSQAYEELEKRVSERTKQLAAANEVLKAEIRERRQVESELANNLELLNLFLEYVPAAIAMFDQQMRYQFVSRHWYSEYNISDDNIIGKSYYDVFPETPERWKKIHQWCLEGYSAECEEDLFIRANGEQQWLKWEIGPWVDIAGKISGIIMSTEVITERKEAQESLKRLNQDLSRSNRELEQFAYVASHDLQEPLRAISSYTQLLAKKYQSHLDAQADKYIHYIVDGATNMQQLIQDLLSFSRVGTHGKQLAVTDCEVVLNRVLDNLNVAIIESDAIVTHDSLPVVMGDDIQLSQLLQNLIGNAIKFRSQELPRVHISAELKAKKWIFSVQDNGIGIEPEYFERIFTIFQRLHTRREYPGTGIGLAVCKKIVERHGGKIWVESELGVGTTFYFSIPQHHHELNII